MKIFSILTIAGISSSLVLHAENPELSGGTLLAKDSKNANRTAKSGEKLVLVAYRNALDTTDPRGASVTANPAKKPQDAGFAKWYGEGLVNPQDGALTVNYSGTSNSNIIAKFSPRGEASVGIDLVNENRIKFDINFEKYKDLIEKINGGLDLIAKRLDGENPVTTSGEISYRTSNTDKYAVGTDYGKAVGLAANFSINLAPLEAKSKDLPTPWPGLSVRIAASFSGLELKADGNLKYDEQYSEPWVASKIKLTAGSTVGVTATATIGPNFAGEAQGLVIEGGAEFLLGVTGEVAGKGHKIETAATGELGSLTLNYSVSIRAEILGVGGSWELYRDSTVVSSGNTFAIEPYTIVEW